MVDRHHPQGHSTALLHLLGDGTCRTLDELERSFDMTRSQITDAAARLMKRDLLIRMGSGCYQLTDAGIAAATAGEKVRPGPRGPRDKVRVVKNTLRERVWRSMRFRGKFTVPDLVCDAATPTDTRATDNIHCYLRALWKAGYVTALPRRAEGGFKVWRLSRNTGPLAPIVLTKVAAIRDRNTGEDVPCSRS